MIRRLFGVVLALCAFHADAEPLTAKALMQSLAQVKVSRATFVEKKYLASLSQPVESSGELVYAAPSRLEKHTVKPRPEVLIVDGDTLTVERNGTRRSISLSSFPEVAAFTDSIRATLAGDLDALARSYRVVLDGQQKQWRLSLLPSDPKIAALVSRVTIDGHDARIETIEVLQADGSRSVTAITPIPDAAAR
jgi:outer membrane lipoprotein-sorting protein